jgi:glyoxylase-like metal-dependent hydrolase (beta-lactamase superfamily II)
MGPLLLRAGNASEWTGPTGTNTWLVPGREPALVDAGVGNPDHIEAIAQALEGGQLRRVFITHSHPDHASGLPALRARWPSLEVVFGARDGARFAAGDGELRVLRTPGHSPDHSCFFDEPAGDVYCGDLLRAGGTIVIPASHGGNLRDYLASLRRIRALAPRRLLPGHGRIVADVVALIDGYIAHRDERDRQILAAIDAGALTPAEIVAHVYPRLPARLRDAAEDTIRAHLVKLRDEGKVRSAAL